MNLLRTLSLATSLALGLAGGASAQAIGGSASLSVTTSSSSVQLPANLTSYPSVIIAPATGSTQEVFYALGGSAVAATTSSPALPGGGICVNVGPSGYVAAITASSTATVRVTQLTTCALFARGPGNTLTLPVPGASGGTGVANNGKTITLGASLTTTGVGAPTLAFPGSSATYTYPATSATLARTDAGQTFAGAQNFGAGSAATPLLSVGNATTGVYSVSTTGLGLTINGVSYMDANVTTNNVWTMAVQLNVLSNIQAAAASAILWGTRTAMLSPANGQLRVTNNATTTTLFDYGVAAATTLTVVGNVAVTAMTQSAVAQSGTVCYNSGTGAITYDATVGCLTSTMDAKDNWRVFSSREALSIVTRLEAGSFTYKKNMGLPDGPQIGLSAQQVSSIDDRLVGYGIDGTIRGVRYQQTSALYGPAIHAISDDIDDLRHDHDKLRVEFDIYRRVRP